MSEWQTLAGLVALLVLAAGAICLSLFILAARNGRQNRDNLTDVLMTCPRCDASGPYEAELMCSGGQSGGCPMADYVNGRLEWPTMERPK